MRGSISAVNGTGSLGAYLRDRRGRLDAATLGYGGRRRTPGLRREEVAQRAGIGTTGYSWLEQGRGGAPSAQALERLADALMLSSPEREHLFLLGLGRSPATRFQPAGVGAPRLQHMLDALDACPALIRTPTWNVIAWNRAAALVFTDYATLPADERNLLRLTFLDPQMRDTSFDWHGVARFIVGVFRADIARSGAAIAVQPLVDELCAGSPDFAAMWRHGEVNGACDGVRRLRHPGAGEIAFDFSALAVDGRGDLTMLVYTPVTPDDAARVRALITAHSGSDGMGQHPVE